jgi:glyoxylase-like metal-dependent hydrolase (beta-lactamase superfamily II)
MQITVFQLGQLGANCYIVADEQTKVCAVVDPGGQGRELAGWLGEQGLTPRYVFLTHGHFDHVGGVKQLAEAFPGLPVYLHPADTKLTPELSRGLWWTDFYEDGDTLSMDGVSFRVLHTPGHTPGSVCLRIDDKLFSGDTLFEGSCGRTDLPGGSWPEILKSLKRLAAVSEDLRVFPGHGGDTTLRREKLYNPYMGR